VACTAVGIGGPANPLLAETWNGMSWTIESPPATAAGEIINGLSCPTTSQCTAVGSSSPASPSQQSAPLIEGWNGSSWTSQTAPDPSGPDSALRGVSCAGATSCTAVGGSFAEEWDGSNWALQSIITPVTPGDTSGLIGVSCPTSTFCAAVGHRPNAELQPEHEQPLAATYNG
jgi:hypothetical protein